MVTATELRRLAQDNLERASKALTGLMTEKLAKAMLADLPGYARLKLGSAVKVDAVVLFVDMRSSTKRAMRIGPEKTFLTMHALLPVLARLIEANGGYIVGYRGDGLFGVFGINSQGKNPPDMDVEELLRQAVTCGMQMVEAVERVVSPALEENDVPGGVKVGVGIDMGEIIVTRIGLNIGFEVTAYGDAINNAAKLCARASNEVYLSETADEAYPSGPGGAAWTSAVFDKDEIEQVGVKFNYPSLMLED